MKRVRTTSRWKRALVATLCAFTLAFSMMGVAWADDQLAAGAAQEPGVTTQADWSFDVYVQVGDNGPEVKVKSYDKAAFSNLANVGSTTANPVSGLYYKESWKMVTAATYVTLDEILADANLADYWTDGAAMQVMAVMKGETDPSWYSKCTYTYETYSQDLYFYPNTTAAAADNDSKVKAPLVFALTGDKADLPTDNSQTAGDVQTSIVSTPKDIIGYVVAGSLESDIVTTSNPTVQGNRLCSGTTGLKIIVPSPDSEEPTIGSSTMHRLYNPNSGEHFFTSSDAEQANLVKAGWTDEKDGWTAPQYSATPVYRLYNANGGEHHYTTSAAELTSLVKAGWNYEGIGWYSDDSKGVKVYRVYNPNEFANNHHYTTSEAEANHLIDLGWKDEGIAFYGVAASA